MQKKNVNCTHKNFIFENIHWITAQGQEKAGICRISNWAKFLTSFIFANKVATVWTSVFDILKSKWKCSQQLTMTRQTYQTWFHAEGNQATTEPASKHRKEQSDISIKKAPSANHLPEQNEKTTEQPSEQSRGGLGGGNHWSLAVGTSRLHRVRS